MRTPLAPTSPQLAHECVGEGDAIVLVPGLGGLGRFWQPVMRELARRHRVLTFDHPGVGASGHFGPQRIERIVVELLRLADRLGIARFACVGHSTGGLVAQALALDAPDRIGALVLSCTWARPDQRFRDLFEVRRLVLQHAGLRAYAMLGQLLGYPATAYESAPPLPAPAPASADPRADVALICERIDMLLDYQRADELGGITQPTLIIAAPDDQIVPFNHAQDLARRIVQAQLVELAGGHFVPTMRPVDYAAVVERFLQEQVPPPGSAVPSTHGERA
jgi:aminoacrylate hydrolase